MNAHFGPVTTFRKAEFTNDASFRSAVFDGPVSFQEAKLSGDATFDLVTVRGDATFAGAIFGPQGGSARPSSSGATTEAVRVSFAGAVVAGIADFSDARFRGQADFSNAKFERAVSFRRAVFQGAAKFDRCSAKDRLDFDDARFSGRPSLYDAHVKEASFMEAVLHSVTWSATFDSLYLDGEFMTSGRFGHIRANHVDLNSVTFRGRPKMELQAANLRCLRASSQLEQSFTYGAATW